MSAGVRGETRGNIGDKDRRNGERENCRGQHRDSARDRDGARLRFALTVGRIDQSHARGKASGETGQQEPKPDA